MFTLAVLQARAASNTVTELLPRVTPASEVTEDVKSVWPRYICMYVGHSEHSTDSLASDQRLMRKVCFAHNNKANTRLNNLLPFVCLILLRHASVCLSVCIYVCVYMYVSTCMCLYVCLSIAYPSHLNCRM